MNRCSLGDRMKEYEAVPKNFLTRRTPVIMRLDGKAFHSFTRGFNKPFDSILMRTMQMTMLELCKEIQGAVIGYTQSDEITIVLQDYKNIDTDAWFGYNVQKMTSIGSSYCTFFFNDSLRRIADKAYENDLITLDKMLLIEQILAIGAFFDCRVFNVPKEEVNNCLIWRQQDAERNSIQALAQSLYSHKQLEGISCKQLQDKMFTEKGVNWNDLSVPEKRGSCAINDETDGWIIDYNIPIFTQDTAYVNDRLIFD